MYFLIAQARPIDDHLSFDTKSFSEKSIPAQNLFDTKSHGQQTHHTKDNEFQVCIVMNLVCEIINKYLEGIHCYKP